MEMLLQMIAMVSLALFASASAALPCTMGQEPDPASNNRYRWVIPVPNPCLCSLVRLGPVNVRAPCRPFPVTYYDSPLVSDDPEEIRQWLNCTLGPSDDCLPDGHPLGMEDGNIPDDKITASSFFSYYDICKPYMGRLDNNNKAWCAASNDTNPWIQVEFAAVVYITGIITQGVNWTVWYDEWVKTYQVEYSSDGQSWVAVTGANGTRTTFDGNVDGTSKALTVFDNVLVSKYLKILPQGFFIDRSMRLEILGCNLQYVQFRG